MIGRCARHQSPALLPHAGQARPRGRQWPRALPRVQLAASRRTPPRPDPVRAPLRRWTRRPQPGSAVVQRAGQDNRHGPFPAPQGCTAKQRVDGRTVPVLLGTPAQHDRSVLHEQMHPRGCHQDATSLQGLAGRRDRRRQRSGLAQDLGKPAAALGRLMQDDEHRRAEARGQTADKAVRASTPPARRTDHHQRRWRTSAGRGQRHGRRLPVDERSHTPGAGSESG